MPQTTLKIESEKKDDRYNKIYHRKVTFTLTGFQIPSTGPRSYRHSKEWREVLPGKKQIQSFVTQNSKSWFLKCKMIECKLKDSKSLSREEEWFTRNGRNHSKQIFDTFTVTFLFKRERPSLVPEEEECIELFGGEDVIHQWMRDSVADHAKKIRQNYAELRFKDQVTELQLSTSEKAFLTAAARVEFKKRLTLLFSELEYEFRTEFMDNVDELCEEMGYSSRVALHAEQGQYKLAKEFCPDGYRAERFYASLLDTIRFEGDLLATWIT